MIDLKYIEQKLENFTKSSSGKKYIEDKINNSNGEFLGSGCGYTRNEMKDYGNKMKQLLYNFIVSMESTDSEGNKTHPLQYFKKDNIIVGEPYTTKNGKCEIKIYFDKEGLQRDSFNDEGLDDIILLFTRGYDIDEKKRTYGLWRIRNMFGEGTQGYARVPARLHRDSNDFLRKAVESFNKTTDTSIKASLEGKYK